MSRVQLAAEACRHEKTDHYDQRTRDDARAEPILSSAWFAGAEIWHQRRTLSNGCDGEWP
jgi:hypothetical protein